jgi:hypothetical protein
MKNSYYLIDENIEFLISTDSCAQTDRLIYTKCACLWSAEYIICRKNVQSFVIRYIFKK